MDKNLFLCVTQPSQRLDVDLGNFRGLTLYSYLVRGVPVDNDVPDVAYYNLEIRVGNELLNWTRFDHRTEVAIPLTRTVTYIDLNHPLQICEPHHEKRAGTISIKVTRPDGEDAVFNQLCLWLKINF